ncbi:tyrosine-type recombinase/integrase [Glaciimonas sp. Gout2]|uniref:tyrosine-type recombinase/integrase n=1 Tax=unclassified Glaciimonas TaxID=2644401 RepID=UPI002B227010|nr:MULTISPECIES: tyrosine-type recombinase/integrase [unclassified Glaciimonas]MEB0014360.1 tyrosine-type recombinase/integrase [Glaciimonas sp. Cout2]MEB0084229.1 tyrosine-type recombinase/integrase [Glaciimonas sp. Gout2]
MVTFDVIDLSPAPALAPPVLDDAQQKMEMFHGPAPDAITAARTDAEIAKEFLGRGELSAASLANTQKELFRFLTWCREEVNKPLRALRVADLNAYKAFLKHPPPDWVSTTRWPRSDARYRPFSGPLADGSRRQALVAVKGLLSYAEKSGYLRRDPGALVKNVTAPASARITRYLTRDAIDLALATLAARVPQSAPEIKRQARDRFLLVAYAATGARLSEIVGATMGALYTEGDGRWWLDVLGKGNKPRRLPVLPAMLDAFRHYRAAFGLPPQTHRADATPLVLSTRRNGVTGVTNETAGNALKAIFAATAGAAEAMGDLDTAATLRNASAHWLRHSMLTHHANHGVQLKTLQDTAGHANIVTTARYLHKSDHERHDEIMASENDQISK